MKEKKITKELCLVFLIRGKSDGFIEVLLAPKKTASGGRDFLIGKYNGYGGGIDDVDEGIPERALIREVSEESGGIVLIEEDLEKVALLYFSFENGPTFRCYTYFAKNWIGEPSESEEMGKPEWFYFRSEDDCNLPFDKMMPGDKRILSILLSGKIIEEGEVFFNKDGSELLGLTYKEAKS